MLRLQAPLDERYTSASPAELDERVALAQQRVAVAVGDVDQQPDQQPHCKAHPRLGRQLRHQVDAQGGADPWATQ